VNGQRGADREPATEQDRQRMAQLTAEGLRAGALGFSTSRTLNHPLCRRQAHPDFALPRKRADRRSRNAMRDAGTGWMQIVSDFEDQETRDRPVSPTCDAGIGRPVTIQPSCSIGSRPNGCGS